ncbi:MAG: hypothetical protein LBL15_07505 [Oscillospiraceae bacterium]|jgi:TRAP-type C4-dicarboxylate transport system permease small subunit|nr:hypothetical protein [Oscillospiraceae bacterium]
MDDPKDRSIADVSKAATALTLRAAVCAYIGYLAWQLLSAVRAGESPIPSWAGWLISAVFALSAAAFFLFAIRQFRLARKAAKSPPVSGEDDTLWKN